MRRSVKGRRLTIKFLGKSISGPFTIPSGIVATAVPILRYLFERVPELGVLTTKSIGYEPRLGNREPVYSQYAPGCFVNAVGLTNPGARRSAELFAELTVPADKFLLMSIFGGSVEEFVRVAEILAPYADGIELNLSCPHAQGYGMAMGQDPELVEQITSAVKSAVDLPVVPKLTPNTEDVAAIAQAAVRGGADAICAINTVGPGLHTAFAEPVLSNGVGGLSGKGVLPIALKSIGEIRSVTDVPIIGCGGVSSARDVREMEGAGAQIVGVGSALTGMDSNEIEAYFAALRDDLALNSAHAESLVQYSTDMTFRALHLVENQKVADDISILKFDQPVSIEAGEFVFVWIPGLGEKPFSALVDDPFTLVVINLGEFTSKLIELREGAKVYVRGPYGQAVVPPEDSRLICVAGGTGLAAVYQLARDRGDAEIFVGARTRDRLYFLEQARACAGVHVATDDGSEGFHGVVTALLDQYLATLSADALQRLAFYNCGPEPMVHAAAAVQRRYCNPDQIFNAIDYLTKCGVGICGACAAPDGRRLCVDGPFLVDGQSEDIHTA